MYRGLIIRREPAFAAIITLLIISALISAIMVPEQTVEPFSSNMHIMNERDFVLHHLAQTLLSPENDSIHKSGAVVEVAISGDNFVICTYYNWDESTNDTMNWVGTIQTSLPAGDGLHILYCYTKGAYDEQPIEWITRKFVFTTDDTNPAISLNSPINGSTHQPGTIVSLNITDINGIGEVYYSWNGGNNVSLVAPFNISLPSDIGTYVLRVYATDVARNSASETYVFTLTELSGAIILTEFLVYGIILATLVSLVVILRKRRV